MSRKRLYLIITFVVVILLFLNSCGINRGGWKKIEIENYGSIEVPENWKVSIIDDFYYFSIEENGNDKNVFVQYFDDDNINKDFEEIKEFVDLQSEIYSNSAGIGRYKVNYQDGLSEELFSVYFTSSGDVSEHTEFLCLDTSISEEILKKIAKSYEMM